MSAIWKPNVTVAAVIERDGRFLLVEEETSAGIRFNQPAGHLDQDETIAAACTRETLEETAYDFEPTALIGVYTLPIAGSDLTYLRFAFAGELGGHYADKPLDKGILRAVWLTLDEIRACRERHRSPLVLHCIEDYLAGKRFPLDLISEYSRPVA